MIEINNNLQPPKRSFATKFINKYLLTLKIIKNLKKDNKIKEIDKSRAYFENCRAEFDKSRALKI